ncbi:MAG: LysR family transcriptional regulator [Alphaproteobacteria bacterium]|nr:LysR family transcriptional regulator [Alphaproteobacteria bacterium]
MDWNLLKVFSEIVRYGGISRAADAIARQQPAVSSALKRLEDHLGVVLCSRGPGGFELTDQGRILWEACGRIESELALLPSRFDGIANELAIEIRVVMVSNLVSGQFDAAIARFNHLYPRCELLISVASCPQIEEMILKNEAEIGVTPKMLPQEGLNYTWLYREQHVLLCAKDHKLFGRTFNDPAQVADEYFVLPNDNEALPVQRYRARHGWGTSVAGQSTDMNEVKRMVLAGLGVALLPREFLEPELERGQLCTLMPPSPETQDDIFVVTHPDNPRYFAVRRFLDLLTEPVDEINEGFGG